MANTHHDAGRTLWEKCTIKSFLSNAYKSYQDNWLQSQRNYMWYTFTDQIGLDTKLFKQVLISETIWRYFCSRNTKLYQRSNFVKNIYNNDFN